MSICPSTLPSILHTHTHTHLSIISIYIYIYIYIYMFLYIHNQHLYTQSYSTTITPTGRALPACSLQFPPPSPPSPLTPFSAAPESGRLIGGDSPELYNLTPYNLTQEYCKLAKLRPLSQLVETTTKSGIHTHTNPKVYACINFCMQVNLNTYT
jgi:hypothetical protein